MFINKGWGGGVIYRREGGMEGKRGREGGERKKGGREGGRRERKEGGRKDGRRRRKGGEGGREGQLLRLQVCVYKKYLTYTSTQQSVQQ